jgi:hypothetical protein
VILCSTFEFLFEYQNRIFLDFFVRVSSCSNIKPFEVPGSTVFPRIRTLGTSVDLLTKRKVSRPTFSPPQLDHYTDYHGSSVLSGGELESTNNVQVLIITHRKFILFLLRESQLTRDVSEDAGVLCDKISVLGDTIKETLYKYHTHQLNIGRLSPIIKYGWRPSYRCLNTGYKILYIYVYVYRYIKFIFNIGYSFENSTKYVT